jgi:hypothetical protein
LIFPKGTVIPDLISFIKIAWTLIIRIIVDLPLLQNTTCSQVSREGYNGAHITGTPPLVGKPSNILYSRSNDTLSTYLETKEEITQKSCNTYVTLGLHSLTVAFLRIVGLDFCH